MNVNTTFNPRRIESSSQALAMLLIYLLTYFLTYLLTYSLHGAESFLRS